MTDVRRRMIHKIRSLMAKKVSAGATEAEAASAAEMAADLMQRYEIDAAAIVELDYDRFILPIRGVKLTAAQSHPFVFVSPGVEHISGTKCFLSYVGMYVVGDDVGRTMAHYLFDMSRNVIDAAWRPEKKRRIELARTEWLRITGSDLPRGKLPTFVHGVLRDINAAHDELARRSYMIGMAQRMTERMLQMPPARKVPEDVVLRIMSDKTNAKTRKKSSRGFDSGALLAGAHMGEGVAIGMGVDGVGKKMLIGSESQ